MAAAGAAAGAGGAEATVAGAAAGTAVEAATVVAAAATAAAEATAAPAAAVAAATPERTLGNLATRPPPVASRGYFRFEISFEIFGIFRVVDLETPRCRRTWWFCCFVLRRNIRAEGRRVRGADREIVLRLEETIARSHPSG